MIKVENKTRLIGTILDILISLLASILLIAFEIVENPISFMNNLIFTINFASLISFTYLFIFYAIFNGTSLGRLFCGTHIVTKDFKRMNIITCFIRAFLQSLYILHIFNTFYQIFNKTHESIFGYITNTTVVKIQPKKHR